MMEGPLSVLQEQGERIADDAETASKSVSEVEKTEDLLLSPERLLDQAKGKKSFRP